MVKTVVHEKRIYLNPDEIREIVAEKFNTSKDFVCLEYGETDDYNYGSKAYLNCTIVIPLNGGESNAL